MGSTSSAECTENPVELKNEISKRKMIFWTSIGVGFGVIALTIAFGCYTHALRMKLKDQELNDEQAKVEEATREITYYRDWRIRPEELQFEVMVASGSEGQVWRGRFQGSTVAIKKAIAEVQVKVYDEAEVAFMIGLQHRRLVKFIGAGTIYDDLNQVR